MKTNKLLAVQGILLMLVLAVAVALGVYAVAPALAGGGNGSGSNTSTQESGGNASGEEAATVADNGQFKEDMKAKLTEEQYNVCFLAGTEPPGSGKYNKHFEPGAYHCVACGQHLFDSDTKYDSGSGWPAFWDIAREGSISEHEDVSLGMRRIEVRCSNCGAHLGHVFDDGPEPTGLRYCINSVALEFVPAEEGADGGGSTEPGSKPAGDSGTEAG
jgi:peptide-methionine (R)-S-oxide reductase